MENCVWGWSWRGWTRRIATVTLLRYTIGFPCAKDRCISDPIHADLNSKKWSPERVFGACFLSVCMLSQVCCRYCFCIYFFCARRCGALCVHACCLCFLFLASVYPFPLFLRLSVRGRRSSRWNKRRNTLIGIFSVLSLFLTVSEIICKLRLCRAGRWRCEIVDIRVASASLEAALGMNRFLSRQLWFFVCLANSSGARVLPDAFLNRRQSPIQKSAHLLRSPNTVLCFCGFLNSFLTYSTYL